jgi:hypothetical protein
MGARMSTLYAVAFNHNAVSAATPLRAVLLANGVAEPVAESCHRVPPVSSLSGTSTRAMPSPEPSADDA